MKTHFLALILATTAMPALAQNNGFTFPSLTPNATQNAPDAPAAIPAPPAPAAVPAPNVAGGNITAANPEGIAAALRGMGYNAELSTDSVGDPVIQSSTAGRDFYLVFWGCTSGQNCNTVQFVTGFDMEQGTSYEMVNSWNRNKRFGKAYLDDELDPFVVMDVNLGSGGVSPEMFETVVGNWSYLVGDFKTAIGW